MRGRPGPAWSVHAGVPPETAYDYVVQVPRHPEWAMDDMVVQPGGDPMAKVGSRYEAEGTLGGRRNKSTVTITDMERPNRLEFEAADANSISGHVFTFVKEGEGTRITRQIYGVKQPFIGPVLFLLFKGAIDKNFNGALAKLKQRLESGTAA